MTLRSSLHGTNDGGLTNDYDLAGLTLFNPALKASSPHLCKTTRFVFDPPALCLDNLSPTRCVTDAKL